MNRLLPTWAIPLNIFHILGTTCCDTMAQEFAQKSFSRHHFCYDSPTFLEANVVVIWGSISKKLLLEIGNRSIYLPKNNYILHINGCEQRVNNNISSSMITSLKINKIISQCHFTSDQIRSIINEAKQCLKV